MKEQRDNEDRQLVESLKKGDPYAFSKLFQKYSKKLYYFAKGYLNSKEDAEGLVQEVFLTVWNKRKELKEHLSFNSFLYTVTYYAICNYFRKKTREKKHLGQFLKDFDGKHFETEAEIEYNNLCELANKAIDKLPQKRRDIYLLSRQDGLTNQEIATRLKISKKTVENQIHQSLKFLKEQLGKETILTLIFYYLFTF